MSESYSDLSRGRTDPATTVITMANAERSDEFPATASADTVMLSTLGTAGSRAIHKNILIGLVTIIVTTIAVRFFGIINQAIVSASFGIGATLDAFTVAQSVPVLLTGLMVSAIEVATIPIFVQVLNEKNQRKLSALYSSTLNGLIGFVLIITAALIVGDAIFIKLAAPGLDPATADLARTLAYIIFPIFFFNAVTSFFSAVLYAQNRFGMPTIIGAVVPIAMTLGTLGGMWLGYGIEGLAIGTCAGSFLQLLLTLFLARRLHIGYRLALDWQMPEVRQFVKLGAPALVSSLFVLANPFVDQIVASALGTGVIASISYALKIIDIFIALFFGPVTRSIFPTFSKLVAERNFFEFKRAIRLYMWGMFLVLMVITALAMYTAPMYVPLLFKHGLVTQAQIDLTVTILRGFLVGVPLMGLSNFCARTINSLQKHIYLFWLAPFSLLVNAGLDVVLVHVVGPIGIALSTSAVYAFNVVVLVLILRYLIGRLRFFRLDEVLDDLMRMSKVFLHLDTQWRASGASRILRQPIVQAAVAVVTFAAVAAASASNLPRAMRVTTNVALACIFVPFPFLLLFIWGTTVNFEHYDLINGFTYGGLLVTISLVSFTILAAIHWRFILQQHPAFLPMCGFVIWTAIGSLHAGLNKTALLQTLEIFINFLGIMVVTAIMTRKQQIYALIDAMLLVAFGNAVFGIAQHVLRFSGYQDNANYRVPGIFDWSNTFAYYLGIMIILTIYRAYLTQTNWRIWWTITLVVEVIALFYTYSRSSQATVLLAVVAMLSIIDWRTRILGIAVGVAGVAAVFIGPFIGFNLLNRFTSGDSTSLDGRTNYWQILLAHSSVTNLLGNGFGAADKVIAQATGGFVNSPHNSYLQVMFDTGIIGMIFFVLTIFAPCVMLIWPSEESKEYRAVRALGFGVLVFGAIVTFANQYMLYVISTSFWIVVSLPFSRAFAEDVPVSEAQQKAASPAPVSVASLAAANLPEE